MMLPVYTNDLLGRHTSTNDEQYGYNVITMAFDRMGRRVEMRTHSADSDLLQRFVYDNYLCVQQLRTPSNTLFHSYIWNSTEPIATRLSLTRYIVQLACNLPEARMSQNPLDFWAGFALSYALMKRNAFYFSFYFGRPRAARAIR